MDMNQLAHMPAWRGVMYLVSTRLNSISKLSDELMCRTPVEGAMADITMPVDPLAEDYDVIGPQEGFRWDEPVVVVDDRYSGMLARHRALERQIDAAKAKAKVEAELDAEQARREKAEEAIKRILEHHASTRLKRKGDRKFLDDCERREDLLVAKMRHKEALRQARWKFDFYTRTQVNLEMADKADAEKRRLEANPPGARTQTRTRTTGRQANCAWEAPRQGSGRRHDTRPRDNRGRGAQERRGGQQCEERFYPSYACAKCGNMHPSNLLKVPGINDIKAAAGIHIERVVDIIQSGTIRCPKCATEHESYKLAQTIGMLNKIEQNNRHGGKRRDHRDREAS